MAKHLFHLIVQFRFLLLTDSPLKEVAPAFIKRDRRKIPGLGALTARWRGWTLSWSWKWADKESRAQGRTKYELKGFTEHLNPQGDEEAWVIPPYIHGPFNHHRYIIRQALQTPFSRSQTETPNRVTCLEWTKTSVWFQVQRSCPPEIFSRYVLWSRPCFRYRLYWESKISSLAPRSFWSRE